MRYIVAVALLLLAGLGGMTSRAEEPVPDISTTWRAPWNAAELAALDLALDAANLTRKDLTYNKRPIDDPYRLDLVNLMLDEPLSGSEVADKTGRVLYKLGQNPEKAIDYFAGLLDSSLEDPLLVTTVKAAEMEEYKNTVRAIGKLPKPLAPRILALLEALATADRLVEEAMKDLTDDEKGAILCAMPGMTVEESDITFAPSYAEAMKKMEGLELLKIARKVKLPKLFSAAAILSQAAAKYAADGQVALEESEWKAFARGPITIPSPLGNIVIGGTQDDKYTEIAALIVDLGGDDTYMAPVGTAIYAAPKEEAADRFRAALAIDVSGNDRYLSGKQGCGVGIMGVGVCLDAGGDDEYRFGNIACGAGICGVGMLLEMGGNDRYYGDQFIEGCGFFGAGMLQEASGDDQYFAYRFSQGYGFVRGVGCITDDSGTDLYYARGKYLHAPLLPDDYQSMSQAFGFGMRGLSVSGGVGIICDANGNDTYVGDVYSQGTSYWFSAGILADGGGNDNYISTQYSGGSGIHLSAGVLLDRSGKDHYYCRYGVGLGGGHDWGVGALIDLEGNDYYQGSGITFGGANANGVGIHLDGGDGMDSYSGLSGLTQGDAPEVRGTVSLGILINMGGPDFYTSALKDGELRVMNWIGIAYDVPTVEVKK